MVKVREAGPLEGASSVCRPTTNIEIRGRKEGCVYLHIILNVYLYIILLYLYFYIKLNLYLYIIPDMYLNVMKNVVS